MLGPGNNSQKPILVQVAKANFLAVAGKAQARLRHEALFLPLVGVRSTPLNLRRIGLVDWSANPANLPKFNTLEHPSQHTPTLPSGSCQTAVVSRSPLSFADAVTSGSFVAWPELQKRSQKRNLFDPQMVRHQRSTKNRVRNRMNNVFQTPVARPRVCTLFPVVPVFVRHSLAKRDPYQNVLFPFLVRPEICSCALQPKIGWRNLLAALQDQHAANLRV